MIDAIAIGLFIWFLIEWNRNVQHSADEAALIRNQDIECLARHMWERRKYARWLRSDPDAKGEREKSLLAKCDRARWDFVDRGYAW